MKTLTTIILISIFANFAVAQNVESSIKEIRKHFQRINSQKDFKTVELNGLEFIDHQTDNGATLKGFFKDGKLYKMEETVGISYAYFTTQYYFWNNKLFFVYRTENQYKEKTDAEGNFLEMDYTKTDIKYQDRQYFKNGKQIRRIEKGEMIGSKTNYPKDFVVLAKNQQELIKNRYKYRNQYKKLQGTWYENGDKKFKVEIDGLILTSYDGDNILYVSRIKLDDNFYYLKSFDDNSETIYSLKKLTNSLFEFYYEESSTDFKYLRK